jgi:Ca2+-transporting ATPase
MTLPIKPESTANPESTTFSWHAMHSTEVLEELHTTPLTGLTSDEAVRRLATYGSNQLAGKARPSFFKMVFDQLNNFIVILLIVAAVVSALLGEWIDSSAIFAIVLLNAVLGVIQESRAEQALAALKKLAAPEAQVLRDGHRVTVPAPQLVPGDIVFLEAGNFIPADLRLLEAVNLRVEEAALTGESVPVQKNAGGRLEKDIPLGDRKNTVFMGTLVNYGRGHGVVVSTGMHTQLGLIANMLQSVEEEETPLQKRLDDLGKTLGWGALAVCTLVFLVGLYQAGFRVEEIIPLFMIAVSLAIAAVPEGLPAVVTISLAMGMREMVHRHALIRRLSSVETLGSATVICSDKTGTLTQNEMTVTRMWVDGQVVEVTGSGYSPLGEFLVDGKPVNLDNYPAVATALWVGVLNNDAQLEKVEAEGGEVSYHMVGDPTEGSILVVAAKAGAAAPQLAEAYPRNDEIPFDSVRKRMLTLHQVEHPQESDISPIYDEEKKQWYVVAVKGAPDVVLNLCSHYQGMDDRHTLVLNEAAHMRILQANDLMTQDALRVLGLAYRLLPERPENMDAQELEKDLIFVGMVGMIDPARQEVRPALEKARSAGIRTIMITGDYPNTARAIAENIGLLRPGHRVMTGNEMDQMDDETLQREVALTDAFARVSPEHKMRIVKALRANGDVVAMTGDGVNDAPAIKLSDIGVAMGITGTDVAKETADMVLTDDNYASIVAAIEQGRIIYSNIRKFVYYLLSCNVAEIAIIFLPTLFGWGSPLTALQLLWLNLVTDGAPALALSTEKGDPDIMNRPPRPPKESIINRFMRTGILVQTIAITFSALAAYRIGLSSDLHIEFAETMAFVTLSVSELFRAFTARSEYYPILKVGIFTNKWMNLAVLSSLALILAVVYVPFLQVIFKTEALGWAQWAGILPLILIPSVAAELSKLVFARQHRKA